MRLELQKQEAEIKKKRLANLPRELYNIGNGIQNRHNQLRSILLNKLTK